jgi:hypothetical protein
MPFRFRKIFSLGKGLRINLSKSGFSTSIGRPGATLNIGRKGIRPTVGIPGTGISFTPSTAQNFSTGQNTNQNKNFINVVTLIISGSLICCISFFCVGVLFFPSDTEKTTTAPSATSMPIELMIELTFNAANKQTQAAQSPTPLPPPVATSTFAPAIIPVEATATVFIYELQTNVAQPTGYIFETNTPFVMFTMPSSNSGGVCSCAGDTLNCTDFSTHASAQSCFDYCVSQGVGDIHKMDGNNDGNACESLKP